MKTNHFSNALRGPPGLISLPKTCETVSGDRYGLKLVQQMLQLADIKSQTISVTPDDPMPPLVYIAGTVDQQVVTRPKLDSYWRKRIRPNSNWEVY